jgi:ABC-type molybdate transport system ATPase subunit
MRCVYPLRVTVIFGASLRGRTRRRRVHAGHVRPSTGYVGSNQETVTAYGQSTVYAEQAKTVVLWHESQLQPTTLRDSNGGHRRAQVETSSCGPAGSDASIQRTW